MIISIFDQDEPAPVNAIPVGGTPERSSSRAFDDDVNNDRRLQEGVRPVQLIPRVSFNKPAERLANHVDVDTPDLFPDECLIHEDCAQHQYCSPDLRCVNACSTNCRKFTIEKNILIKIISVCGAHALCTAALHRPVCACEDGYEGNPYDRCTKVRTINFNRNQ